MLYAGETPVWSFKRIELDEFPLSAKGRHEDEGNANGHDVDAVVGKIDELLTFLAKLLKKDFFSRLLLHYGGKQS